MLYQKQHGGAHKAGIKGIHNKIRKMLYGIKIRKVQGYSPRWQCLSVGKTSVSHTASKHRVVTITFSGQEEPTALLRKVAAVQGDSGREASTGMTMIFLTRIINGVNYQMVATVKTLQSIIAVAVMVTTILQWLYQQTSLLSSIATVATVSVLGECVTLSFT